MKGVLRQGGKKGYNDNFQPPTGSVHGGTEEEEAWPGVNCRCGPFGGKMKCCTTATIITGIASNGAGIVISCWTQDEVHSASDRPKCKKVSIAKQFVSHGEKRCINARNSLLWYMWGLSKGESVCSVKTTKETLFSEMEQLNTILRTIIKWINVMSKMCLWNSENCRSAHSAGLFHVIWKLSSSDTAEPDSWGGNFTPLPGKDHILTHTSI